MNIGAIRLDRHEKEEELRRLIPDLGPIDSKLLFTKADTKIDKIRNEASVLNYETIEVNITTERTAEVLQSYSPQRVNEPEHKLFESKSPLTITEVAPNWVRNEAVEIPNTPKGVVHYEQAQEPELNKDDDAVELSKNDKEEELKATDPLLRLISY